jgi:hypothetical protein
VCCESCFGGYSTDLGHSTRSSRVVSISITQWQPEPYTANLPTHIGGVLADSSLTYCNCHQHEIEFSRAGPKHAIGRPVALQLERATMATIMAATFASPLILIFTSGLDTLRHSCHQNTSPGAIHSTPTHTHTQVLGRGLCMVVTCLAWKNKNVCV